MQNFPKVWKLINNFKLKCLSKGWKTSEIYDWVLTEDQKYHALVWAKIVSPASFERIALNRSCIVKEGLDYRVVKASYYAWIFENSPPESLLEKILTSEEMLKSNAIYDISKVYQGENICLKINKTESRVFKEFEEFLKELGVKILSFINMNPSKEISISKKL